MACLFFICFCELDYTLSLHSTRVLQTLSLFILYSICAIYCTLSNAIAFDPYTHGYYQNI